VKPLRIAGLILAGGGGVALVSAITSMSRIGSCGNGYDAPCPPGTASQFLLMTVAILAIAIGSVMTIGLGLLFAMVTAGVAAIAYAVSVPASMRTGEYVTAGVCFGLLALLAAIGQSAVRRGAAARKSAREQIAADREFRERATMVAGTVTALRDTGVTINDNPQAAIMISYTRADGIPAQAETVQVLPRLQIPRPGDPATVWYDPATGKALAELGSPDSHRAPA
jgi:uncharacterized membrane protein